MSNQYASNQYTVAGCTGPMPDKLIRQYALSHGMIEPFAEGVPRPGIVSYGVSHYGYDFRVKNEWVKIRAVTPVIDLKNPSTFSTETFIADTYIIYPGDAILAVTVEKFHMPTNAVGIVLGKSTYARHHVVPHVTPIEPGWIGHITVEIANVGMTAQTLYANEGMGQIIFLVSSEEPEVNYATKGGKYQNQGPNVTEGKVL